MQISEELGCKSTSLAICLHKMQTVDRAIQSITRHAKISRPASELSLCVGDLVLDTTMSLHEYVQNGLLTSGDSLRLGTA